MSLLRVATGLALNRAAEHRWRRTSVPLSALLFMMFLLAATSIMMLVEREDSREVARTAVLANARSETDLFLILRPDDWRGRTILVAWLEPTSANAVPVLPPGIGKLPTAGQSVVSPALDRLAARHPELAARYPDRLVIESTGVRSGGDLFAYVRAPTGRSLGSADAAFRVENGRIVGDGPAFRIGRFGTPDHAAGLLRLGEPQPVPIGPVVGGLFGVLVLPGVILLGVGAAAASEVRNRRLEVLQAIGASTRTVTTLSALETLILAIPGLVAATILWALLGPRLTTVPLVGYEVVPGDLSLPWWLLIALLGVAIVVTTLVAVLVTSGPGRLARPRPAPRRTRLSALRVVPLAVAIAAFTLGKIVGGYREADFYLIGVVSAVAGIPAVVPVILRAVGLLLARARSTSVVIAARAMEWDPTRAARPFVGGAALLFLVVSGAGYIALSNDLDAPRLPTDDTQAVTVEWQDREPDDLRRFGDAVGTGLVVPFIEGDYEHRHDEGETHHHGADAGVLSVGATCAELASYLPGTGCDAASPLGLPDAMQQRLAEWLALSVHGTVAQVRLVPRTDLIGVGSALVLDTAPLRDVDERARTAAMKTLPAPYVQSLLSSASRESPLIPWVTGGLVAAVIGLTFACLLSLIDRLLGVRSHDRHLVNLGISRMKLTALGAWTFAVPYTVVVVVSLLTGSAACALLILPTTPMPWTTIGMTAAAAAAVGALGTVGVGLLGSKRTLKERE